MSLSNKQGMILACGTYNGALGAGAVPYGQRGGVMTRNNVGLYDITLDRGALAAQCVVLITVGGAARGTIRVTHTSDTVKRVAIRTGALAPAAVDTDVNWIVISFAP